MNENNRRVISTLIFSPNFEYVLADKSHPEYNQLEADATRCEPLEERLLIVTVNN